MHADYPSFKAYFKSFCNNTWQPFRCVQRTDYTYPHYLHVLLSCRVRLSESVEQFHLNQDRKFAKKVAAAKKHGAKLPDPADVYRIVGIDDEANTKYRVRRVCTYGWPRRARGVGVQKAQMLRGQGCTASVSMLLVQVDDNGDVVSGEGADDAQAQDADDAEEAGEAAETLTTKDGAGVSSTPRYQLRVTVADLKHNHPLSAKAYAYLAENRKVTNPSLLLRIDELQEAGASVKKIVRYLRKNSGS